MLGWSVLGCLCHEVMIRVWKRGVLNLPNLFWDGSEQVGADETAEDAFRRKRSKRASRLLKWLDSKETQMWATAALLTTEAITVTAGDYLQDEYMYDPRKIVRDENGDNIGVLPWLPPARHPDRQIPTLKNCMENDQRHLRKMQDEIIGVLTISAGDGVGDHFIQKAFPSIAGHKIFDALQSLSLETLGDTFLRFHEYRLPTFGVINTILPECSDLEKDTAANNFEALKLCCRRPHFEEKILARYTGRIRCQECSDIITAWAERQVQVTKAVEFAHRCNASLAAANGPAKPADLFHVADGFVCQRTQVLHGVAVGKPPGRRASFRFKQHPQVKSVLKLVKNCKSKKHPARAGIGSNPKYLYLNNERETLSGLGLCKAEFDQRVADAARAYDGSQLVQDAARDAWRLHKASRASQALQCPTKCLQTKWDDGNGYGPFGMGDSFWPLGERHLQEWLNTHTKEGGLREVTAEHKDWQRTHLSLGDNVNLPDGFVLQRPFKTCYQRHPGMCDTDHSQIKEVAECIAAELSQFRQLTLL
jgi:hypothetical protein